MYRIYVSQCIKTDKKKNTCTRTYGGGVERGDAGRVGVAVPRDDRLPHAVADEHQTQSVAT